MKYLNFTLFVFAVLQVSCGNDCSEYYDTISEETVITYSFYNQLGQNIIGFQGFFDEEDILITRMDNAQFTYSVNNGGVEMETFLPYTDIDAYNTKALLEYYVSFDNSDIDTIFIEVKAIEKTSDCLDKDIQIESFKVMYQDSIYFEGNELYRPDFSFLKQY